MPYTLMKGLGWFLAALLLGILIGWLLRSIAATRQMRKLRAVRTDHTELDRLRARNANLEPVVAERDRLVAELTARVPSASPAVPGESSAIGLPADLPPADAADVAVARAELDAEVAAEMPAATEGEPVDAADVVVVEPEFTELNLVAASAVLGRKVKLDDLTVIQGVDDEVAALCKNIGIHTWVDMAGTEASLLRTMLIDAGLVDAGLADAGTADAGKSVETRDPSSWPAQAALLAAGQWEDYTTLVASLSAPTDD